MIDSRLINARYIDTEGKVKHADQKVLFCNKETREHAPLH